VEGGRIAAIEAGGTKVLLAAGHDPTDLTRSAPTRLPSTDPRDTAAAIAAWLRVAHEREPFAAVGVASFGPFDRASGTLAATTPKAAWRGFSWTALLRDTLPNVPVALDSDTNAAALAEATLGASRGTAASLYCTVGTGIGGGIVLEGAVVPGGHHPEVGHQVVGRVDGDDFAGCCPVHGDCLEGLASGPALAARWDRPAETLEASHPAWELEATYLARGLANLHYTLRLDVIVLGGGVSHTPGLRERVAQRLTETINGYVPLPRVVAPALGDHAGLVGAGLLARALLA
jgi:fructokinase